MRIKVQCAYTHIHNKQRTITIRIMTERVTRYFSYIGASRKSGCQFPFTINFALTKQKIVNWKLYVNAFMMISNIQAQSFLANRDFSFSNEAGGMKDSLKTGLFHFEDNLNTVFKSSLQSIKPCLSICVTD